MGAKKGGPKSMADSLGEKRGLKLTFYLKSLIPHPVGSIADGSKPLGGFTVSRMSGAGGRDVVVAMRDCGISTTSQTHPVCKHCFSALPIDKTSSVEAQIGLLWRGFCSSSYRVWD